MSSLPASTKRIGSKATEKRWRHCFPHYKSMGAFGCHGNQSFDPNCPKTLCSLSPTPVMLLIKFDQDWPTGFRDIQVWKCGRRRRRRRRRRLTDDDGSLVYYKLTLWAFGSGKLTTEKRWRHRFPHYKSMGPVCCHGNQSFDPICPKTLCSFSPTPVMLHIKCNQDWPTGFRDIQVWKCGRRRRTDEGPLIYYKLTLWAFSSDELKMEDPYPCH